MKNPWLDVPLADYEGHMALPGIEQAQLLSDIFADALAKFSPCSVAVIGCAGGNGFDRIPPAVSRVVGVDLNPLFVAETEARFRDRIEHLELIAGDIQSPEILFSPVDLIFLGLVLEYVDVDPVVAKMLSMLTPRGHMVTVLQLPSVGHQQVSPSPFKKVSPVGEVMHLVSPTRLQDSVETRGYIQLESRNLVSQGGKPFEVQTFGTIAAPDDGCLAALLSPLNSGENSADS
ncbi:class I SAM-dependent methyltransferase [Accumulibacter sp.]|nr:class I SAM-dependent methyltransferase [Accumulibacter sp.]HRE71977.1 class I SAM-dependent methyltransferase [Accumulibacter sp.]